MSSAARGAEGVDHAARMLAAGGEVERGGRRLGVALEAGERLRRRALA